MANRGGGFLHVVAVAANCDGAFRPETGAVTAGADVGRAETLLQAVASLEVTVMNAKVTSPLLLLLPELLVALSEMAVLAMGSTPAVTAVSLVYPIKAKVAYFCCCQAANSD